MPVIDGRLGIVSEILKPEGFYDMGNKTVYEICITANAGYTERNTGAFIDGEKSDLICC